MDLLLVKGIMKWKCRIDLNRSKTCIFASWRENNVYLIAANSKIKHLWSLNQPYILCIEGHGNGGVTEHQICHSTEGLFKAYNLFETFKWVSSLFLFFFTLTKQKKKKNQDCRRRLSMLELMLLVSLKTTALEINITWYQRLLNWNTSVLTYA